MENELIFCACGCGQTRLKYDKKDRERKYINHHSAKGIKLSEEAKRKISKAHLGIKNSKKSEALKKLYKEGKLKPFPKGNPSQRLDFKEKIRLKLRINLDTNLIKEKYSQGYSCNDIGKELNVCGGVIRNRLIEMGIQLRHYKSSRARQKISRIKTPEEIEKIKRARTKQIIMPHTEKWKQNMKKRWQDEDYRNNIIKKTLQALYERPTSYEKKISELCIENKLPFIYTGNGTFLIGYKNPDFIHKTEKIAIEVYHNYWKIRDYGSCENYEKQRSEYFAKYGWNVIFIRTEDVLDKNWKERCLNKIKLKIGVK